MSEKAAPQPAHELFVEFDKRMNRLAEQAEEDRKRAAKERAEDRKQAAQERAEDRKRERERDEKIAQERAEDRKRAAQERAEDREREREWAEQAEKRHAEIDKRLNKTAKQIGDYTNNEGELLEMECRAALEKMGNIGGVTLEDIQGMRSAKHGVEVDIVGINGKIIFPVEVKRTLSPEDVRHFADVRVERFRKAYEPAQGKEVRPVIIFGLPRPGKEDANGEKEDPVQVALDLGLIVMQTINENELTPITDPKQVIRR